MKIIIRWKIEYRFRVAAGLSDHLEQVILWYEGRSNLPALPRIGQFFHLTFGYLEPLVIQTSFFSLSRTNDFPSSFRLSSSRKVNNIEWEPVPGKNGVFEPVIYLEPGGSNDSPNYVNENHECVREKITEWVGKLQGLKFSLCA